jgi:hypothetical protein
MRMMVDYVRATVLWVHEFDLVNKIIIQYFIIIKVKLIIYLLSSSFYFALKIALLNIRFYVLYLCY